MRTTVVLPVDLLRAAKARSAESGETLKALLTRAVAAELETAAVRRGSTAHVTLPLFGDSSAAPVRVSNAGLEQALADDDAARVAIPARRKPTHGRSR